MPRPETSLMVTRRWVRANKLDKQDPLVMQLLTLAATEDREMTDLGRVNAATAECYRLTFMMLKGN